MSVNESFLMPCLQERWSDRHSAVREMWSNEKFSLAKQFKQVGCWWYTQAGLAELEAHREIYKDMENYPHKGAKPKASKLWWLMDQYFALYYEEFPFKTSNKPKLEIKSMEDLNIG